jgi:hypothetical protein
MRRYGDELSVRDFDIIDNNFDVDKIRTIAEALGDDAFRWKATSRIYREMTVDVLRDARHSGCRLLALGLEAADDGLLRTMKKGFRVETASRVLQNAATARLPVHLYAILGHPGETIAARKTTIQFLRDHRAAYVSAFLQFYDANLSSGVFVSGQRRSTVEHTDIAQDDLFGLIEDGGFATWWSESGVLLRPRGWPINDELFLLALSATLGDGQSGGVSQ